MSVHDDPQQWLGRRHAADERDRRFLLRDAVDLTSTRSYRYWPSSFNVNQTGPTCVANTMYHLLGDSPRRWRMEDLEAVPYPGAGAVGNYLSTNSGERGFRGYVYDQAQQLDEFSDTPPEGGTSARGACKALVTLGVVEEYRWLETVDEVVQAIFEHGPVAFGTNWYAQMYYGVKNGSVIHAAGDSVGGHEVLLDGVGLRRGMVRVQTWGIHLWLPLEDLERLLGEQGDAVTVSETPR